MLPPDPALLLPRLHGCVAPPGALRCCGGSCCGAAVQKSYKINTVAVLRSHGERGRRIVKPPARPKDHRLVPARQAQLTGAFLTLPTSAIACRDHFRRIGNARQGRGEGGYREF
jgi:hypothetical protein